MHQSSRAGHRHSLDRFTLSPVMTMTAVWLLIFIVPQMMYVCSEFTFLLRRRLRH